MRPHRPQHAARRGRRRPRPHRGGARGGPAQGQHAAVPAAHGCATSRVDPAAAFAGTFHINEGYAQLQEAYAAAAAGRVPQLPPCEIYCHSLSDRSILGPELAASDAQTLTLFGLHLPARLFRGTAEEHDAAKDLALAHTLESLNSVLAEPIQDVLLRDPDGAFCLEARTPVELEADLGLPGGNIFHRSLQWPWAERETRSAPGASRPPTTRCASPEPAPDAAAA